MGHPTSTPALETRPWHRLTVEQALAALRTMAAPTALVVRGRATEEIQAARLVPGDVVLLSEGRIVPADLRVCEAAHLEVAESVLTGESFPATKETATLAYAMAIRSERASLFTQGVFTRQGVAGHCAQTRFHQRPARLV